MSKYYHNTNGRRLVVPLSERLKSPSPPRGETLHPHRRRVRKLDRRSLHQVRR
jgi:hypothetical protein